LIATPEGGIPDRAPMTAPDRAFLWVGAGTPQILRVDPTLVRGGGVPVDARKYDSVFRSP